MRELIKLTYLLTYFIRMNLTSMVITGVVLNPENHSQILMLPSSIDGSWVTKELEHCLKIYPNFAAEYRKLAGKQFVHHLDDHDLYYSKRACQNTRVIVCCPFRSSAYSPIDIALLTPSLRFLSKELEKLSQFGSLCISSIRDETLDNIPLWRISGTISHYVARWLLTEGNLYQRRVCYIQANLVPGEPEKKPPIEEFSFTDG